MAVCAKGLMYMCRCIQKKLWATNLVLYSRKNANESRSILCNELGRGTEEKEGGRGRNVFCTEKIWVEELLGWAKVSASEITIFLSLWVFHFDRSSSQTLPSPSLFLLLSIQARSNLHNLEQFFFYFFFNRSKSTAPKNHRECIPCPDGVLQHKQVTTARVAYRGRVLSCLCAFAVHKASVFCV